MIDFKYNVMSTYIQKKIAAPILRAAKVLCAGFDSTANGWLVGGVETSGGGVLNVSGRAYDLLPLVVGQSDALRRHLEVHHRGGRGRGRGQCLGYRLGNGLRAGQRLHVH